MPVADALDELRVVGRRDVVLAHRFDALQPEAQVEDVCFVFLYVLLAVVILLVRAPRQSKIAQSDCRLQGRHLALEVGHLLLEGGDLVPQLAELVDEGVLDPLS